MDNIADDEVSVIPKPICRWLCFMTTGDTSILDDLLADDLVFYSPAVFSPQEGVLTARRYLEAAEQLFSDNDFRYTQQWFGDSAAALEFEAEIDGIHINGVDLIRWNESSRIDSFKVFVRPLRGLQTLVPLMGALLESSARPPSGRPSE
ncbi:nuclear transport factor 2 family protein [Mycobacterium sp. C31M]